MDEPQVDDILSSVDKRSGAEERWVSFQPYLLSKGYRLRPRYHPHWVPSWKASGLRASSCEDSIDSMPLRVLDAIRVRDETQVMIKTLIPRQGEGEDELAILQHFSSPLLRNEPANHVVPCLDTFPIPGVEHGHFVVMPLLRQYDDIAFQSVSEVHDFLRQIFEGLIFMHENNVAHCDVGSANIMMNSRVLYDEPFHPVDSHLSLDIQRMIYPRYSRLEKNLRYYLIDMGFATWLRDPNAPRLVTGKPARIMAPEQRNSKPYDPFLVDVYQLGTVISQDLIPQIKALSFLIPLTEEMAHSDPSVRPPLIKAQQTMDTAFLGLSGLRYRWPLVPREAGFRARWIYFVWGVTTEIRYWLDKALRWLVRLKM
ncbi:Protein kinase domain [Rhizoctonia solani]|uniref:Protein kinase domain n=1 Tax=Rhizoctonia solani TaxID=456999 RepID=A0A8H7HCC9_9AGAM|nr:Protein kinase domain [Rhizoctonia solani]